MIIPHYGITLSVSHEDGIASLYASRLPKLKSQHPDADRQYRNKLKSHGCKKAFCALMIDYSTGRVLNDDDNPAALGQARIL
jgi:hypothetical protein